MSDSIEKLQAASPWPDEFTRATLQVFADGLIEFAGFGMAVISVLREDNALHVAAVGGADEQADAEIRALRTPVDVVLGLIADGEEWGLFRFVPADATSVDDTSWGWVPDIEVSTDPRAWHPLDVLLAPLRDDDGNLVGTLSLDLPPGGRRPNQATREQLNSYAEQAGRAIVAAIERRRLNQQAALATAARTVVHEATLQVPFDDEFAALSRRLSELFGLSEVRFSTMADDDAGIARSLWTEQRVSAVDSMLTAPLGAGDEAVGSMTLLRPEGGPLWTEAEQAAALEIGRDLGRVVFNAKAAADHRVLAVELEELDALRSTMVRTVAHELKNPLTVIAGNLELLDLGALADFERIATLRRMTAAAERMTRIVDDLTTLSEASGDHPPRPNDLGLLVREACYLANPRGQGLRLRVRTPPDPVLVAGDTASLDRLVINLISNAVKYTDVGGIVEVTLRVRGEVAEFMVHDTGIGIPPDDQERLFQEFFRASNADHRPGTGLGLTIASRITRRLGGRISVESEIGQGSTFRVELPLVTRPDGAGRD